MSKRKYRYEAWLVDERGEILYAIRQEFFATPDFAYRRAWMRALDEFAHNNGGSVTIKMHAFEEITPAMCC